MNIPTFIFLICWHNSITRLVPSKLMLTVGLRDAWKSSVAAEWNTTFTLSTKRWRSAGDRPRSSSPTSPVTGMSFLNISGLLFSKSVSKIWIIQQKYQVTKNKITESVSLQTLTVFLHNSSRRCSMVFPFFDLMSR